MSLRFLDEPGLNKVWNAIKDINPWMPKTAAAHNSIYRRKDVSYLISSDSTVRLYDSLTDASNLFNDVFVGDYFRFPKFQLTSEVIDQTIVYSCTVDSRTEVKYTIVGLDLEFNRGQSQISSPITRHTITLMPDAPIGTLPMNDVFSTTTSGYVGTTIYSALLDSYSSAISSYLLNLNCGMSLSSSKHYLTSASSGGEATAGDWYRGDIRIPSVIEILGVHLGPHFEVGSDSTQFPAFAFDPQLLMPEAESRTGFWLRTIRSDTQFYRINEYGQLGSRSANESNGVRPVITIGPAVTE